MLKKLIHKIKDFYRRFVESTLFNWIIFCYFVNYYISSFLLIFILVNEKIYSLESLQNVFIFLFRLSSSFLYCGKLLIKFSSKQQIELWVLCMVILLNLINFSLIPLLVFNFRRFFINWKKSRIFWIIFNLLCLISIYSFIQFLIWLRSGDDYALGSYLYN